jgi:hypothetical protein
LTTPGGKPAYNNYQTILDESFTDTSLIRAAQYKAVSGVSSAGFKMTTLPIQ